MYSNIFVVLRPPIGHGALTTCALGRVRLREDERLHMGLGAPSDTDAAPWGPVGHWHDRAEHQLLAGTALGSRNEALVLDTDSDAGKRGPRPRCSLGD